MEEEGSRKSSRWLLIAIVILVLVLVPLFSPYGRGVVSRLFNSLRVQKVQAVNVNLSSFVGPDANQTLRQMVSQMIASNVKTTVSEKGQIASSVAIASQVAGFPVELLSARSDAPEIAVTGARDFTLTVDRTRLQSILQEAGRSDLSVPSSINGATVSVKIPRTVRARYGNCPRPPSATANIATPPPNSVQYTSCVILAEGPSPQVNVPQGLDFSKLAEIALEVAGMSPAQAQQFLQNVNWRETLGVPIPRFMRSYESVKVGGVNGTLLNMADRRGPTYTLIWAKNGMVYSLTGYGNSSQAVSLANSLRKD